MLTTRPASHRILVTAFFVVLVVGTVFNLAFESSLDASSRAIRPAESAALIDLAQTDEPSLPVKVGFALSLRAVGEGGVLIVPTESGIAAREIEYLAGMALRVEEYDATIEPDSLPEGSIVNQIRGNGKINLNSSDRFDYVIVWRGPTPVAELRLFQDSDGSVVVVDETLTESLDR